MQSEGRGPPGGVSAAAHSITVSLPLVSRLHQSPLPVTHHTFLKVSSCLTKEEQFEEKMVKMI